MFDVSDRTVTYWRQQGAPIIPRKETNLAEVSNWLNARNSVTIGAATSNHYVTALRGFGRWLATKANAVEKNPFECLEKIDARSDIRKKRRVLEPNQFAKFIDAVSASSLHWLRASEAASVSSLSFSFASQPPVVTVEPAYTKNSLTARVPLPSDFANQLEAYLKDRDCGEQPIWPGTWNDEAAEMIRIDLKAAGIAYKNSQGKDYDFHALRHQYITDLAKAKVPIQVASELARHSKLELTAKVYTHLTAEDTASEIEKLNGFRDVSDSSGEIQPEGDFGKAHGKAAFAKPAYLSDKLADSTSEPENEKSPVFMGKTGLFDSDADGTRTRNHWIDSPVL